MPAATASPRALLANRTLAGMVVAGAGQITAVLQVTVVLAVLGIGRESDLVVLGTTAASAPSALFAQGALYNYTLARPGFQRWKAAAVGAALLGPVTMVTLAAFLSTGDDRASLFDVTVAFSLVGLYHGALSVLATQRAVHGAPRLMIGLPISLNLMVIAVALSTRYLSSGIIGAIAGIAISALLTLWYLRRIAGTVALPQLGGQHGSSRWTLIAFTMASVSGYFGPFVLQALIAQVATGLPTIIGLLTRLANTLLGTAIGTWVLNHSPLSAPEINLRRIYRILACGGIAAVIGSFVASFVSDHVPTWTPAYVLFVVSAAITVPVGRVAARRGLRGVVWLNLVTGSLAYALGGLLLARHPDINSYYVALTLAITTVGIGSAASLRWRGAIVYFVCLALTAVAVGGTSLGA